MANIEINDLLRELAMAARDKEEGVRPGIEAGEATIDDRLLDDYRQGRLDADSARALEARMATDPKLREALATKADLDLSPPSAVRDAVLGSFEREATPSATSPAVGRGARRRWWSLAAAAVFVMAIFGSQVFQRPRVDLPPLDVAVQTYETRAGDLGDPSGANATRDALTVDVEADEPFSISLSPTLQAVAGVDVGLYRLRASRLERIDHTDLVRREVLDGEDSGRFVISRPGDALAGSRALWVVVGYEGALDSALDIDPDVTADTLKTAMETGGEWLVYRVGVTILNPTEDL